MGAGASADCIPVIAKFKSGVAEFNERFKRYIDSNLSDKQDVPSLKRELDQFYTLIQQNPTVDILAKKFYLKKKWEELSTLKKWLTIFFHYRQYLFNPDDRYDKFIAALAQEKDDLLELPSSVSVITWNYDLQFEICMSEFLVELHDSLPNIQSVLNVYPRIESSLEDTFNVSDFNIIRLNNTAGVYIDSERFKSNFEISKTRFFNRTSKNFVQIDDQAFKKLIEDFNLMSKVNKHVFTYCWEKNIVAIKGLEMAKRAVDHTQVLVVIGYSFPFVNSKFDYTIISRMKQLQEVIIQDKNDSKEYSDAIESRFKEILGKAPRFTIINDVNEFYLPGQLKI